MNQKQLWNSLHEKGKADGEKPTTFAQEVIQTLPSSLSILELGCGSAIDAAYFAQQGHTVIATDFSEVVIAKNKKRFEKVENLLFQTLNMDTLPFPFKDNSFYVVYAHLSLHYFSDKQTKEIFKEIHRILKPTGYLCFVCKSTKDPLYGKGEIIEKDMYRYNNHIRHFFSKEYMHTCLKGLFTAEIVEKGTEQFYHYQSAYITCIARPINV